VVADAGARNRSLDDLDDPPAVSGGDVSLVLGQLKSR